MNTTKTVYHFHTTTNHPYYLFNDNITYVFYFRYIIVVDFPQNLDDVGHQIGTRSLLTIRSNG